MRRAYDQYLADKNTLHEVSISDHINISDMKELNIEDIVCLEYECRCGGSYVISKSDLDCQESVIVVPCTTCSLFIEVQRD